MTGTDWGALIDSWADRLGHTEHTDLEIIHAAHVGHKPGDPPPLGPTDPVPGCSCVACATLAVGGSWEHAGIAEAIVQRLTQHEPAERLHRAERAVASWAQVECVLPSPSVLSMLAARVPGARRDHNEVRRGGDRRLLPLPVEAARAADILKVARRLGLGEPVRRGAEWATRCPFHEDTRPSLRLNVKSGLWYCDPCAMGGDGINLVRPVRGVEFADAVREVAA